MCMCLYVCLRSSWLALARLEAKLGNIERAREVFSQSMARCPNNVHILHAWGHLEQKHGNEMLARDCWSQAMALEPLNAYVCHALSNLEKRLRNFERAREVLEAVVQTRPTSALCVSLAELERQLGNVERAKEALLHGLENCDSDRSKLLLALAWLEEDAFDNPQEAWRLLNEALRYDKNNVRIHIAKASMELRGNKVADARATLKRATQLASDDGQHYTMWATLEIDSGNFREARRLLEEGAAKFPGDQFLLQRWGALEAKHGSVEKARELFDRAIIIQPHAPTFVAWAILEEDQGIEALNPRQQNRYVVVDDDDDDAQDGDVSGRDGLGDAVGCEGFVPPSATGHTVTSHSALAAAETVMSMPGFSGFDGGALDDLSLLGTKMDAMAGVDERKATRKRHNGLERDLPLDFSADKSAQEQQQIQQQQQQPLTTLRLLQPCPSSWL